MDSLNSLLIGFYTLLSYSNRQRHTYLTLGSWKRDVGAPMLLTGIARKTRKGNFFFFFPEPTVFPNPKACLPNTSVRLRTRVCVCCAEARDMPTLSRICFSPRKTPFVERYFLSSKNPFSLTPSGARIISFLYLICEASTVLLKANCSLSCEDFFPEIASTLLLRHSVLSLRIVV